MDRTTGKVPNMVRSFCKGFVIVTLVFISIDLQCSGYTLDKSTVLSKGDGGLDFGNKENSEKDPRQNTVFSTEVGLDRKCGQTSEGEIDPWNIPVDQVDHTRRKRDLSSHPEKFMEVLLVTDSSVVNFHGRSFLEQYLLTQMNLVDAAYHHPTLHIEINIMVSNIVVVQDSTADSLVVKGDGKRTLDKFCDWANRYRHKDPYNVKTFDVALFITRKDIGPAGYAPVTGMCHPHRSCAVNKDAGVSSAYVITHEIGHILGMVHDGYGNKCDKEAEDGKVMAATVQANYENVHWTECSRRSLEHQIGSLHCLEDKPKEVDWPKYAQPYGVSWTLDEQCRQEFGEGYRVCRVFVGMDMCDMLWCSSDSEAYMCKTKRSPPLPGTSCGYNMWCMDHKCREKDNKEAAIHGGWTDWSDWGKCSRVCGVGVQHKYRRCTNPTPEHGGRDCKGDNQKYRLCNKQLCEDATDFRAEQCSAHDHKDFRENQRHTWLPAAESEDQCKLTCVSAHTGVKFVSEKTVIDGTPCSYDNPDDVCINGECHKLGCDKQLGSSKKEDKCGVCGGDGTTCTTISGHFDEVLPRKEYHKMVELPKNARDIVIKEEQTAPHLAHFLAVKDESDLVLLNSNEHQGESKEFIVQGSKFIYDARGAETLTSQGPLLGKIQVLVYSLSSTLATGIHYEYSIPQEMLNDVALELYAVDYTYAWQYIGWSECSHTCDTGSRSEVYECVEENSGRTVSETLCRHTVKPNVTTEDCNTDPCFINTYSWRAKPWSSCSGTCGKEAVRTRTVTCFVVDLYGTGVDWQVEEKLCDADSEPERTQPCDVGPCQQEWVVGEWGECSETCGYGIQKRTVQCGAGKHNTDECPGKEPHNLRLCKQPRCPVPSTSTSTTQSTTSTTQSTTPTTQSSTSTTQSTTPTTQSSTSTTQSSTSTMQSTTSTLQTSTLTTVSPTSTRQSTTTTTTTAPTSTATTKQTTPTSSQTTVLTTTTEQTPEKTTAVSSDTKKSYHGPDSPNEVLKIKYRPRNWHDVGEGKYRNRVQSDNRARPDRNSIKAHINNYQRSSPHPSIPSPASDTSSKLVPRKNTDSVPSRNRHVHCTKDKSFFCKMRFDSQKCTLPLYQKYCCMTCKKLRATKW